MVSYQEWERQQFAKLQTPEGLAEIEEDVRRAYPDMPLEEIQWPPGIGI